MILWSLIIIGILVISVVGLGIYLSYEFSGALKEEEEEDDRLWNQ